MGESPLKKLLFKNELALGMGDSFDNNSFQIDSGISDFKTPYYPNFKRPFCFEEEVGGDNGTKHWKKLFDEIIRNPQHSNLI